MFISYIPTVLPYYCPWQVQSAKSAAHSLPVSFVSFSFRSSFDAHWSGHIVATLTGLTFFMCRDGVMVVTR